MNPLLSAIYERRAIRLFDPVEPPQPLGEKS